MDPTSTADITQAMARFLDTGGLPNARIVLNPTDEFVQSHPLGAAFPGAQGCTAGMKHACLVLRDASVFAYSQDHSPAVFNDLVSWVPNQPPGSTWWLRPTDLPAAVDPSTFQLDLTGVLGQVPFVAQARDYFLDVYASVGDSMFANHSVPVDANGDPDGANLTDWRGMGGLWIDFTVRFPNGPLGNPAKCRCARGVAYYWDGWQTSAQCNQACQQVFEKGNCETILVYSRVNSASFSLGLVPEIDPACDLAHVDEQLAHVTDPNYSFADDPRLGWMGWFPGGAQYRQPCLRVHPVVWGSTVIHPAGGATDAMDYTGDGGALRVELHDCDLPTRAACEIFDCDQRASEGAATGASFQANDALVKAIRPAIASRFEYRAGPGSPLHGGVPSSCALLGADPMQCIGNALAHYLPASLTYIAYNWFAAPFGPIDNKPWHQYPVYAVESVPVCPDRGVETDIGEEQYCCHSSPNPGDVCHLTRQDSHGRTWCCVKIPLGEGRNVQLDYLADPDGDGLVAPNDNCPFDDNPDQANSDHDALRCALSADGTQIVDRMLQSPGGVFSARDLERGEVVGMSSAMSAMSLSVAPAPRSDFQAVYSRALGRLFLVGGNDAATGEATHDIWWFDVDAYQWNRVPLDGYSPERVLAATYSYRDRHLWVLDDQKVGALRQARLVRIDPATGQSEQIGAWPRAIWPHDGVFDKHWLMLDSDGNVLFVASSEWVKKHAVVRIAVDGSPRVDAIRLAPRALLLPPAVDSEGYTFVLEKKNHMPVVQRVKDLNAKPGRWLDLGGCL